MGQIDVIHAGFLNQFEQDMWKYGVSTSNLYTIKYSYAVGSTQKFISGDSGESVENIFVCYNARRKPVFEIHEVRNFRADNSLASLTTTMNGTLYLYDIMDLNGYTNPMELGVDKKGYAFENIPIVKISSTFVAYKNTLVTLSYPRYDVKGAGNLISARTYKFMASATKSFQAFIETTLTDCASKNISTLSDSLPTGSTSVNLTELMRSSMPYQMPGSNIEDVEYRYISQQAHEYTVFVRSVQVSGTSAGVRNERVEVVFEPSPIQRLNRIRSIDSGTWVNVPTGNSEGEMVARKLGTPFNNIYGTTAGGNGFANIFGAVMNDFDDQFPESYPGKTFSDYQAIHDYVVENIMIASEKLRSSNSIPIAFARYLAVLAKVKVEDVPSNMYSLLPYSSHVFDMVDLYDVASVDLSLTSASDIPSMMDTYKSIMGLTSGSFYTREASDTSSRNFKYYSRILGATDAGKIGNLLKELKKVRINALLRELQIAYAEALESLESLSGNVEIVDISKAMVQPMTSIKLNISGATLNCVVADYNLTMRADGTFSASLGFFVRVGGSI